MTSADCNKKISQLISCGSYNKALATIEKAVDRVFCDPVNAGRIFGSPELDQHCQAIGKSCLNAQRETDRDLPQVSVSQIYNSDTVVYLASKLQPSGGHTAALADVIRLSPPAHSVVMITATYGRTSRAILKQIFDGLPDVQLEYVPPGNHLSKLEWVQRRLFELSPNTVWLFNHHQDSVAIAAIQPDQGYRVRFYHHGDHHLCLGVHLDYAEHFDPHPMGFHNCRESLGIMNNQYLPMVVSDCGDRPVGLGFHGSKGLVTCTAGSFNKVEVPYFIRYVEVVPEILRITSGRHIHIGKLTLFAIWRIRRGLIRYGIDPKSFTYVSYVPSVWRALHEFGVDVYLASFPYGGGRTLIEVMGAGVPAVIHKHCANRMLGGFDMAYDGAFIWQYPEELLSYLRSVNVASLVHQGRQARSRYEKYHREDVLRSALEQPFQIAVPLLKTEYRSGAINQSLQKSQVGMLRGVLYLIFCRYYRRWQALLGRLT